MKKYLYILIIIFLFGFSVFWFHSRFIEKPFISLFPIEHYDQHFDHWIKQTDPHYQEALLSKDAQAARFLEFKRRYFGELSPWNLLALNKEAVNNLENVTKDDITKLLKFFNNQGKSGNQLKYRLNHRPYTEAWINDLETKMNLSQFDHLSIDPSRRAITIKNSQGRALPTEEPIFYHYSIAGEGYPFDNLQSSTVWAGTPLYILGETQGKAWILVQTPDLQAWIPRSDVATVDDNFISQWTKAANKKLIAITNTQTPIIDQENNLFWNSGYLGMVFPGEENNQAWKIMIPVRDEQGNAKIHFSEISQEHGKKMPVLTTPQEFIGLMQKLIGRTYGWGGLYANNDCASELKNLMTPFGIWIPMHSSDQVNPKAYTVNVVDLSNENPEARLKYLKEHGRPFTTILYVGGHVVLYLGTYPNPDDPKHQPVALTFQNVWALKPFNPPTGKDRRAIIGGSVLLPILSAYPEDLGLASDAGLKYFQLGILN